MPWSAQVRFTDCASGAPLAVTAAASIGSWKSDANGVVKVTEVPDADEYLVLAVGAGTAYADAYVALARDLNTSICLAQRTRTPPPVSVPVISTLSVVNGVLTVGFVTFGPVDAFHTVLVTLDPPFPEQPNGAQHEIGGHLTSYAYQNLVSGHRYRFSIQSVRKDDLGSDTSSEWVSIDFSVSYDSGWIPPMRNIRGVSATPGLLEVFAVAADQQVYLRGWPMAPAPSPQAPWAPWVVLGGNFPAGNTVSVVARNPDQLD